MAWEKFDSVAQSRSGGNCQAQFLTLSSGPADAGESTQMARALRGNIWKALGRRLACRPPFAYWAKLSFLCRSPDRIPDQHSYYLPASLIPVFDSNASKAYLERRWQLLGKLLWILPVSCMQFRKLSLWARTLLFPCLLRFFQQFYKWWCFRPRDGPNTDNSPATFWHHVVLHNFLWFCTAILVHCLSCIHKKQFIGSIMPICDGRPGFSSLAQFTVILLDCLSSCVSILYRVIPRTVARSECFIENLCDSLTVFLPSLSSVRQLLMLIWFLLLFNRVLPASNIFTITLPAGQLDGQMHSVLSPKLVLGPSMNGSDTNVADNSVEISNVDLCASSGDQQAVAQSSSGATLVATDAVVGDAGRTLCLASISQTTKVEQSVLACSDSHPDVNHLVHHNLSDMNKLGKLHFATVFVNAHIW